MADSAVILPRYTLTNDTLFRRKTDGYIQISNTGDNVDGLDIEEVRSVINGLSRKRNINAQKESTVISKTDSPDFVQFTISDDGLENITMNVNDLADYTESLAEIGVALTEI